MLAAKLGVSHAFCIPLKIACLGAHLLRYFGVIRFHRLQGRHQLFNFSPIQQALLVDLHPGFLFPLVMGVQLARNLPKMLAGVVEIDNLNGARKVQGNQIPNPFGAVTDHYLLEGAAPATSIGLRVESPAKLFRTLDGSAIGGGIGIADGKAFLIPPRLGEDASQFDFPGMGLRSYLADRPSFFTTGTPVPSICTYKTRIGSPVTTGSSHWRAF